jgi:ATP-dependent helicase YprA (DUF1998 family)
LGHEYLTDVLEIRLGVRLSDIETRSALYALLESARDIGVAREDIDGTLHRYSRSESAALIIFDSVPGGAGYALIIAQRLPELFNNALDRVSDCECGEETSCYNCLRSYSDQIWHDTISRKTAIRALRQSLGSAEVL